MIAIGRAYTDAQNKRLYQSDNYSLNDGRMLAAHSQPVVVDAKGNILEWWAYDGWSWHESRQELAVVDRLVTPEVFYGVMVRKRNGAK